MIRRNKKRILITGSDGFVGSHLVSELRNGYVIGRYDRNTPCLNVKDWRLFSPDIVFHLAANARVHKLVMNPSLAKENFDISFKVLEFCRVTGTPIVFTSSKEALACDLSPYASTKKAVESLIKSYNNCYNVPYVIFRLSSVYGEDDSIKDRLVPSLLSALMMNTPVKVFNPKRVLDFTYVGDVIKVFKHWLDNPTWNKTYNVGTGKPIQLMDAVHLFEGIFNKEFNKEIQDGRVGEEFYFSVDKNDLLKMDSDFGYHPTTELSTGIKLIKQHFELNGIEWDN